MYLHHFGLNSDPFGLDPNLDYIFTSKGHEETIAHLVYGLEQGENFVLITGAIGTGKTLALHYLIDQIVDSFRVVLINVTQLDFREILKFILNELGLEYDRQGDRADLLSVLKSYLEEVRVRREKVLVIVDEAQNLAVETIEGLRLLSNLSMPGEQALQIVLSGQLGLDRMIATPELEQLSQRIRIRYRLENLSVDEIGPYIAFRIQVAGGDPAIFRPTAIAEVFRRSRGIPRLVNQYASQALLAAYVDGNRRVKPHHVQVDESVAEEDLDQPLEVLEPAEPEPPAVESILKNRPPVAAPYPVEVPLRREILDLTSSWFAGERAGFTRSILVWAAVAVTVILVGWYLIDQTGLFASVDKPPSGADMPVAATIEEADSVAVENPRDEMADEGEAPRGSGPDGLPADEVAAGGVEPETSPPVETAGVATAAPATVAAAFTVHVASYDDSDRAERQVRRLIDGGHDAFLAESVENGEDWIRVYLGRYGDQDAALAAARQWRRSGVISLYNITRIPDGS